MVDGRPSTGFGRLDILVNNAGITRWVPITDMEALTDEIWDMTLDVNVKGAYRCARAAAPHLKATGGMIVNVSSISGVIAPSTMSSLAYGTAKAGLIYMTRGLAVALGPEIRVNAGGAAFTDTQWMRDHYGADYDAIIERASANYPAQAGGETRRSGRRRPGPHHGRRLRHRPDAASGRRPEPELTGCPFVR